MDDWKDTAVASVLEQLIEHGPDDMASVFARAFELAMRIERERFLGAGHYERTPERRGYANGAKPKRIDTPAGTVNVQVPKARNTAERVLPAVFGAGPALLAHHHARDRPDVRPQGYVGASPPAMPPSYPRSASARTAVGVCSASRSRSRRPRCTGATS